MRIYFGPVQDIGFGLELTCLSNLVAFVIKQVASNKYPGQGILMELTRPRLSRLADRHRHSPSGPDQRRATSPGLMHSMVDERPPMAMQRNPALVLDMHADHEHAISMQRPGRRGWATRQSIA